MQSSIIRFSGNISSPKIKKNIISTPLTIPPVFILLSFYFHRKICEGILRVDSGLTGLGPNQPPTNPLPTPYQLPINSLSTYNKIRTGIGTKQDKNSLNLVEKKEN